MYANRGFQTYQNVSVMTAPPERLLLMLYEGLNKNIKAARLAVEENNAESRRNCLRKARDIVTELMSALNFEIGGDIAVNLHRLYRYVNGQLIQADISAAVEPLNNALEVIDVLNDAWVQAVEIYQNEQSGAVEAAGQ